MSFPAKTSAETILEAALEILNEQGQEGLSMRTLAARLGVRASSLYHHYGSREELEQALAGHAERVLVEALRQSNGRRAAAAAYREFAREKPALFVVFSRRRGKAGQCVAVLREVLQVKTEAEAVAAWCFLQGCAWLEAGGMVEPEALERSIEAWAGQKGNIL